jgi:MFS family permease
MNSSITYEEQVAQNYKHNFIVNFLDGSFFWLGYSFLAPGVILPLYVSHLTGNKLLIGLVAVISATGFFLPQLFTANWIEHLPRKKVAPVTIGFFTERVPLLLLPGAVLVGSGNATLALILFFIFFGWHSFGAGAVAVGWQDMIAKIFPAERRGFFMGLTTSTGTATGVLGAYLAAKFLDLYIFPYGFVICFAIAGVFILASWVFLAMTREFPVKKSGDPVSQIEYWKKLPTIFHKDANFTRYILSQTLGGLGGMAWGFMAVYAQQNWSLSDGKVGTFSAAMLIGQAIANLSFGILADRKGYKIVLVISTIMSSLSMLLAVVAPNPTWFYVIFGLRGISLGGGFLALLFVLEFCTPEIRPTYIGISNTTLGVINIISPLIGGWLASISSYPMLFGIALVIGIAGLAVLAGFVRDPRHRRDVRI